ncbi:sugar ABC transporter substrate-binding protein [Nocardioides immobilis]|uniref:Sugar ABC transporter substrate-binding protein n=1 Tax=Nocardioides immobilis TaxID=2049295 RepID=A0A417XX42_9ACTN|nr:sugar ABC transporter substrate-binding protein [Nocardioides immobilis]RHW24943.1 sugar ABC transporter substrate-binding protein [Nocardioides immobilis]
MIRNRLFAGAATTALVAALFPGCSSESGNSDAADPEANASASRAAANEAEAAGQVAAEEAGDPVTLEPQKIGILQIIAAAESALNAQKSIEAAADAIGWTTVACDAQGDPVKTASCGQSLLDQGVDGIVSISNEPSLWKPALDKAKAENIPVINVAGNVGPDPAILGSYAPDNGHQGEVLADYIIEQLQTLDGDKGIAVHTFPASWGEARTEAVTAAVEATDDVEIVATASTDPTNVQAGTSKTVTDQLTQNPDLKAIWFSYDVAAQAGAQAVGSKFPGTQFPDRPLVTTFGTDSGTLALLRQGSIDAVIENATAVDGWVAIDQLAEFFARDRMPTPGPTDGDFPEYGDFPIASYRVFEKDDVPGSGPVPPVADFEAFFTAKWAKEFGA